MEETAQIVLTLPKSLRILLYSVLTFGSFAIPFTFSQHQIVTGTLVNAALIASAILFPGKLFLPLIFLPSLAVLGRGIIFGPLTPFLVYFIPFIWLGNLILVLVFKNLNSKIGFWGTLGISSISKYFLLFSFANLFLRFHIVPKMFVQTMGILQLVTVISGGILVFFILKGLHGKQ